MEDTAAPTSHKKSAADEMISTDHPPVIAKNHTYLLQQRLPRTKQIFFDRFLLKTPQPGRPLDIWRKTKSYILNLTSKSIILLMEPMSPGKKLFVCSSAQKVNLSLLVDQ
jgi:hypothetical protein